MSTAPSKKRKRDAAQDESAVTLQLSGQPLEKLGPVLASFPALQPPQNTPFQCYATNKSDTDAPFHTRETVVAGEADTVEFFTSGESATPGCSYLVGIHDKRTNTTTLRPAPLHILARQVKALKNLQSMAATADERVELRNRLGEAFGTKKAKAAIRAAERNRVDVDAMQGVAGHLQHTIQQNTSSLPTQEEAKASADSSRLIPAYNADATRPEDVYPLHNIIPEAEFNALQVGAFRGAGSHDKRVALLPYTRSKWIEDHLFLLFEAPRLNKNNLKILMYISAMLAFRAAARSVNDQQALQSKLPNVPSIVIDGLLSRFTETVRNTNTAKTTSQTETRLLTHMLALCLRLDDFATDTTLVAHDLSMAVDKVNMLFKSLGCKIEKLDQAQLKRLGLPDSVAETKRAVLKVPLQFPKTRMRRAGR
ncbi:RNA polymerase I associated factor, A49-like protein [Obba rivulosa]|uniref:RNA polymerase I associated factor, A49-like protein n=1 Tax=Obba rivulosa TaxID=1052685 RepID=A0A8E2AV27_9APHY|nr:RNA polymerase I associated factor, A49-like protein [Obba rivulosa]